MFWVIQHDKSDDKADVKFWQVLFNKTVKYKIFEYKPFMNGSDIKKEIGEINEPVMFIGSIPFISKVQRISEYVPGTYCNFDAFRCKSYYPILGDLLFNSDYRIVKWKDLLNHPFGGVRFIRPDSGKKVFLGTMTDYDHLTQDVGLSIANIEPNTLVLTTTPKHALKEWRFFVCNHGFVLAGSQYHDNHFLSISKDYPEEAFLLATKVCNIKELNDRIKDPVYVVDICLTEDDEFTVMELNSFSCSGLYDCDVSNIVNYIEEINK